MEYCNGGDLTGCLQQYKKLYHETTFSIDIVKNSVSPVAIIYEFIYIIIEMEGIFYHE